VREGTTTQNSMPSEIAKSVAIRGERGNYNSATLDEFVELSVAIRGERGNYNCS